MRIRKIATSVGILGKILNSKSSSKQDTYSCDYINNNFNVTVSPETPKDAFDLWVKSSPSLKLEEKGYTSTLNGLTVTVDNNYDIMFNGTTSKETQFDFSTYPISKNENIMSVKGGNENCQCGIYFFNDSGAYVAGIRSTNGSKVIQSLTDNMTKYKATIKIPAGTKLTNYRPKMQIIYGSKDVEYSAYVEPAIYVKTNERYNLISNKDIYAEGENLIGEFLGKPLYRQVFLLSPNIDASQTAVSFDVPLENVAELMIDDATMIKDTKSSPYNYTFPFVHSDINNCIGGYPTIEQNKIIMNIRKGNKISLYGIRLVLKYTKTTD